ncbi:MAG TPA: hypothetical protein VMG34_06910 [Bacteroidota bacterium]|nr:hypothetical protein [Bacteroidota bacterium]
MKSARFWIAVAVSGVVMNVLDFVGQAMIMTDMYYAKHPDVFLTTTNPAWYVLVDFVTVFVLAWVFTKVAKSFSAGWRGGAAYGLYAGILVNFPTWIMTHLMLKGFSYKFAWFSTFYGIVWTIIAAAVIAAIYPKEAPTAK